MPQKKGDPGPEPAEGAAAKDGKPDENELERRRRAKATSVAERAGEGDDPAPEEELFPEGSLDGDSKVSLKNIIKAGTATEATASMGTASVPIKGTGFFDPEEEVTLLVRCLPGGIVPVATRKKGDEKNKIEKWRLNQPLTPIYVQDAGDMYTREQVLDLLHEAGVSSAVVSRLMGEPQASAQG